MKTKTVQGGGRARVRRRGLGWAWIWEGNEGLGCENSYGGEWKGFVEECIVVSGKR